MKNLLVLLIGVIVLVGLFLWLRPAPSEPAVSAAPSPTSAAAALPANALPEPAAPAVPAAQQFDIVVAGGQRSSGPAVISVTQGTEVTLRITTDHADELHLHGYDLSLKLPKGEPATLRFVANRSGRFEYELHHSHLELGALEVQPR